jgi:hypothetical protein
MIFVGVHQQSAEKGSALGRAFFFLFPTRRSNIDGAFNLTSKRSEASLRGAQSGGSTAFLCVLPETAHLTRLKGL